MLTEKVDYVKATDLIAQSLAADLTVFQNPLSMFSTRPSYVSQTATLGDNSPGTIIDTYSVPPIEDGGYKFIPEMNIPAVLGIETTDKTSSGVFETPPSGQDNNPTAYGFPIDATPLNNDATDGLTTLRDPTTSPLGLGYSGGSAYIQATDPMSVSNAAPQDPAMVTPDQCLWYDFPCKFQSIKGEATIIIIGIILLGVGVFALTR